MNKEQKDFFKKAIARYRAEGLNDFTIAKHLSEKSVLCPGSTSAWRKRIERMDVEVQKSFGRNEKSPIDNGENDTENETTTETNQYVDQPAMSAMKPDGTIMSVQEYCVHYGLPDDFARTAKLVAHTGIPRYNIASKNLETETAMTIAEIKEIIREGLEVYEYAPKFEINDFGDILVIKIADLHFGAYIDGLIRTKKFSIGILADRLNEAARKINALHGREVHIHLLGDLIESFTGLNHKNSWKGLQKGMIGAEAVKLCATVLHKEFLSQINNLVTVKVIAGNHDRVTANKDEDTDGDAADLIAWGLELMGYKVEFNPFVIKHVVDGICHIIMHGDKPASKKSTKDICWDYGEQGMFNLICEGHLHSIIEKLAVAQRTSFQTIKDDAVDHRRMICPSIFTGNSYSEYLGYTSNAGFVITKNCGTGIPDIFYMAL